MVLMSVLKFCAVPVIAVELSLLDESRKTCDSLRQGEGFSELRSDPMWKDLRFRYQFDDQTGNWSSPVLNCAWIPGNVP